MTTVEFQDGGHADALDGPLERGSYQLLMEGLNEIAVGMALYDADDRLVLWNEAYLPGFDELHPGLMFEDMLRRLIARGGILDALGREEEWIAERMIRHRAPSEPILIHRATGWIRVQEHRTSSGATLIVNYDLTELKHAEEAVRRQRDLFETILNAVPVPVFWKDRAGVYLGCNKALLESRGLERAEQVVGKTIFEVAPTREEAVRAAYKDEEVMSSGETLTGFEGLYHRADGNARYLLANKVPLRDAHGEVAGIVGAFIDITERKRLEDKVEAQRALFRAVIDHIPDCVFWKARDGTFTGCNAAYAQLRGQGSADAIVGRSVYDIGLKAEEASRIVMIEEGIMATGEPLIGAEEVIETKDGQRISMTISRVPMRDGAGNVIGLLGIFSDITERKRAEETVRNQKALLEAVLDAVPVPIFVKDAAGVYLHCNGAYESLMGAEREDIIGGTIDALVSRTVAERARQADRTLFESGGVQAYELAMQTARGLVREVEVRKAVFKQAVSGLPGGLVGVIVDLTERKRAEAVFRQMSKAKALGSLAAGMAHELNNLLLPLVALSRILVRKCAPESPDRGKLEAIAEAAGRSSALIGRVLALSRQDDDPMEPLDPWSVVSGALQSIRVHLSPAVALTDSLERRLDKVCGNAVQLRMVVEQIVANAIDARKGDDGRVRVSMVNATVDTDADAAGLGVAPGAYVRLRVADNGRGMSQETLDCALDPFFTTKEVGAGCGLGLTLVQKIVEHHRGGMRIVSKEGKGTIVDVFLPLTTG